MNPKAYISLILLCTIGLTFLSCNKFMASSDDSDEAFESHISEDNDGVFVQKSKEFKGVADNMYHLIDPQTQMQVLQYEYPSGWMTSGKAQWLTNSPNVPHSWYIWSASPDGLMKFIVSSSIQMGGQGRIGQNPMLNDPSVLANQFFIPGAQNDYHLSNIAIRDMKFIPDPNAVEKQRKIANDVANYGMRATDVRCVIYSLELTGNRDGKQFFVSYMVPMNVIETRPGISFVHTIEMPRLFSEGGPVGTEDKVSEILNKAIGTIEMNPNFEQFKNQIAQMQTQQAMAEINRRYEIMHQRHLQNMADSDARLNNFLKESDRKHAQVMGRNGTGGASGNSGSMLDKWDEYIKDVDLVQNPNGGDLYIDNRHDHAWINSDNEVMYMDSDLFNPNENSAFNQREWKKIR